MAFLFGGDGIHLQRRIRFDSGLFQGRGITPVTFENSG